jgi:uncharacterized membrane protein
MTTFIRDVTVKAPVDRVSQFIVDPHNLTEIWPNFIDITSIKKSKANEGYNYDWTYKMSGQRFEGKAETIDFVPREHLVTRSDKGLVSTITWKFQPAGQETRLTLKFEYEIPKSLLNKVNEKIIVQENEHELDAMLENLKTRMEFERAYV